MVGSPGSPMLTRTGTRPGARHMDLVMPLSRPTFGNLQLLAFVALACAFGTVRAEGVTSDPPAATDRGPNEEVGKRIEDAVVQVFSTVRYPDPFKPWTKQEPREISGTGVVIEGRRILTNAHVVLYATQVQVRATRGGDKLSATVEAVAPGMDLAVLKLEDAGFFDAHPPLPRENRLPGVKDAVLAYGFPTGGSNLSVTKGIVSRVEFTPYNFPVSGLRIQIDAAINPGNSGGPAVVGEKMIGLAFSRLGGGTQNIGYIIPCEEIALFLADIADGKYDGKPALHAEFQTLESEALRAFLKLDRSVEGIVVHQPERDDGAEGLRRWDVITRIGDVKIDDQGMVQVDGLRLGFGYLVQKLAKGGRLALTVWREGKRLALSVPVASAHHILEEDLQGEYPPYFVYGPIVFSRASGQLVGALLGAKDNTPIGPLLFIGSPLLTRGGDRPAFPGEELVVVSSPFLPHRLAKGYGSPALRVVQSVNGVRIRNLLHLVQVLRDAHDEYVVFEFAGRHTEDVVLRRKEAVAATEEILNDNGIRTQGSPEVMAAWNGSRADVSAR